MNNIYEFKTLTITKDIFNVKIDDELVILTKLEYQLLFLLVKNVGTILTKERIVKEIWRYETSDYRSLQSCVKNLRRKIKPYDKNIICAHNIGYGFIEH